jgi:hypothetical protein
MWGYAAASALFAASRSADMPPWGLTGRLINPPGGWDELAQQAAGAARCAAYAVALEAHMALDAPTCRWGRGTIRPAWGRLWRRVKATIRGGPPFTLCLGALTAESKAQAALLRDLFGPLPFRAVSLDRASLALAMPIAVAAYDARDLPSGHLDSAYLAVLADALEDAGADQAILDHLRGPGPHVRGCWALDCVLARE